jgi:hypothetical protein
MAANFTRLIVRNVDSDALKTPGLIALSRVTPRMNELESERNVVLHGSMETVGESDAVGLLDRDGDAVRDVEILSDREAVLLNEFVVETDDEGVDKTVALTDIVVVGLNDADRVDEVDELRTLDAVLLTVTDCVDDAVELSTSVSDGDKRSMETDGEFE